jgi:glycerol uptake facilitator-like aquaporin
MLTEQVDYTTKIIKKMEASGKYSENGTNGIAEKRSAASSSPKRSASVFMKYVRPCFAEFFVVLIFVFVGVCSVANVPSFIPLVHGLAIMVLAFLAGGIRYAYVV